MWVVWVAVFLPMFVSAITGTWNGHITPRSMEIIKYSLWLLLAACGLMVAVSLRRAFRRANNPSS
jgi:hypothetical protein